MQIVTVNVTAKGSGWVGESEGERVGGRKFGNGETQCELLACFFGSMYLALVFLIKNF
jgi:hypothetical protein